jgi:hypothetical protein
VAISAHAGKSDKLDQEAPVVRQRRSASGDPGTGLQLLRHYSPGDVRSVLAGPSHPTVSAIPAVVPVYRC